MSADQKGDPQEEKYQVAQGKRAEYADAVVNSTSKKKIVVAGPGTGKTYLFRRVLEGKKNTLTLTFVNNLVEELSLELFGLSEVRTLHGFALQTLKKVKKSITVFPKLSTVIREDASILLKEEINFDEIFNNRDDENEHIEFYKKRKAYYAHYGFSDIVFAAVKYFEENTERVPSFDQIVVDEFQDFNKLEVSLIDLLAEKSPILLAGDDDQALYAFKSASPEHLRLRHGDKKLGYSAFALPYCSRCTRVIVDAANDLIDGSRKDGFLANRIDKPFRYFDDEVKDRESAVNSHLLYYQVYAKQIPSLIESCIGEIASQTRESFSTLIISPYGKQCRYIADKLKEKGFQAVHYVDKDKKAPSLLDGLGLLLDNDSCNLGWRIVAKQLLDAGDFEELIKKSDKGAGSIVKIIEPTQRKTVAKMLKALRSVKTGKKTKEKESLSVVLASAGYDADVMEREWLRDAMGIGAPGVSNRTIMKMPITVTTIQGSKGLSDDVVFIANCDDRFFLGDQKKVTDLDICNFLVALTRARKRVIFISTDKTKDPVFLKWIDRKRIAKM
jgi:superfamily I DNA/RNA helicase